MTTIPSGGKAGTARFQPRKVSGGSYTRKQTTKAQRKARRKMQKESRRRNRTK